MKPYKPHKPEEYYIKKANGRYEHVGYGRTPDLHPGLWLIQSKGHSRSYKNAFYRLGDVPEFCEVEDMVKCMMLEDIVANAIVKWADGTAAMSPADMARKISTGIYEEMQKHREAIAKLDNHLRD